MIPHSIPAVRDDFVIDLRSISKAYQPSLLRALEGDKLACSILEDFEF